MEVETPPPPPDLSLPSTSTASSPESIIQSKLGNCEVCNIKTAKYTCPRCEVKTCCLQCAQIHKKELECTGERDRTRYIPLNKFSNLDLSSDYRLLEEISRNLEACKKNRPRNPEHFKLPRYLFRLQKASEAKKIKLKLLPSTFNKRKRNTTVLNFHKNTIYWHIEWIFVNADNLKFTDEKVRETEKICNVFSKYLVKQEDRVIQEKLQYYQAVDLPGIKFLLKAEYRPGKKYFELDPMETIEENLRGKTLIEFPVIHVMLKEHACGMEIVDSGDEEETDTKVGNEVINQIIMKSEKEDSIYSSLKNLLFISEYSDEDDMVTN